MSSTINEKKETLYDVFHNACLKYPNNTAVLYNCGNNVVILTYLTLITEIEKLSEHICRVCENCTYIGICIKNVYLAPTIILGILRVHKAYVVVEEDGQLLQRLGCAWVLAEQGCWVGAGCEPQSRLELHGEVLGLWAVAGVVPRVTANVRLAYAMQTSGTTGQPTVVQVPHSAILPNITDLQRMLQVTERDVVYLAAPLTFDPSVVEMFLALESGAALLVAGPAVRASPQHLLRCLFPSEDSPHPGVTVLQVTPSTLGRWLGVHGTLPRGLRVLLLGGEPCPPLAVLRRWTGGSADCRVFNVYGLTEVSCWASLQEVCWDGHVAGVPLGSPLSCTVLSVRDQAGHSITRGEGEMFVGSLERTCFIGDEEVKAPTAPVFRATGDIVKRYCTSSHLRGCTVTT